MSDANNSKVSTIGWVDLTVAEAGPVRDFYQAVVGWNTTELDMGGYSDFLLHEPQTGASVAGICHARGPNAEWPAAWLIYIYVPDLAQSMARCVELGGAVIAGPRTMGEQGRYCVVRDPAGAVAALFQAAT